MTLVTTIYTILVVVSALTLVDVLALVVILKNNRLKNRLKGLVRSFLELDDMSLRIDSIENENNNCSMCTNCNYGEDDLNRVDELSSEIYLLDSRIESRLNDLEEMLVNADQAGREVLNNVASKLDDCKKEINFLAENLD